MQARPGARKGPKHRVSLEPNERNFLSLPARVKKKRSCARGVGGVYAPLVLCGILAADWRAVGGCVSNGSRYGLQSFLGSASWDV